MMKQSEKSGFATHQLQYILQCWNLGLDLKYFIGFIVRENDFDLSE